MVSGLLAQSGVAEGDGGRYLLIDSGCGHLVHTLMATRPASRWLGLDRDSESVAWSAANVTDAAFAVLPDRLPLGERDASFDGAVALDLSKRLDFARLGEWLEELWRLVRPGGFVVLGACGYAALAHFTDRQQTADDDVRSALRTLDETGTATLALRDHEIRLFGENHFAQKVLGQYWQSSRPIIGGGPRFTDLYVARRREAPRSSGELATLPTIGTVIEGIVDGASLASVPDSGVVTRSRLIARAGAVRRSVRAFLDLDPLAPEERRSLKAMMAERRCSWPDLHLLTFPVAWLVGQGTLVVQHGERRTLLRDSAREFLSAGRVPDGLERHGQDGFAMRASVDRRVEAPCLLLKRPWANNFGHWLIDQASMLSWLVRIGEVPSRRLVVAKLNWVALADVMRETVAAILPGAEMLEHPDDEVWRFDSLAWAMPVHVPPLFKLPAALDSLRSHLLSVAAAPADRPRRLHVVRAAANSRRIDNESELLAISARYGFVPVHPERLALADQVALFAGAEAVVGVKGAALTNILFAEPACPLIVLSPAGFTDLFHWNLATLRGHPFWELYGPVTSQWGEPGYRDFRVDPVKFERMLRQALAGQRAARAWQFWRK